MTRGTAEPRGRGGMEERTGRSGAPSSPGTFIRQPRTVLRILAWFFSIAVFAPVVNEGYINSGSERLHCIFNKSHMACNYAISVGVLTFLATIGLLLLDAWFPQISSVKDRRRIVLLEMLFSGFWTFLWFVGFCFLANQWGQTSPAELPLEQAADAARAAIAFCFFSILIWAALTLLAAQKLLLGTDLSLFSMQHLDHHAPKSQSPTDVIGQTSLNDYKGPPVLQMLETRPQGHHVPPPAF
ncbi:synaptogyrin-3-like [Denticeps clupeoides]|uniref:MARVEL domain-containing protein n=1 Tax=Denticeps clupeoides TaxID=299321 RepID=A0A8C3ZQS1_9TELE|nr:synaptogyrin-3-like [Denticeps clupeoides]XP_028829548.1 synaptogyrin-3-like [Denticeps clupeoides]